MEAITETAVRYKAKDGATFSDKYECIKYEAGLDAEPGTVGYVINLLKEQNGYVDGIVLAIHHETEIVFTFYSKDINDNCTTKEAINRLSEQSDMEDVCHHMLVVRESLETKSTHSIMTGYNPEFQKYLKFKKDYEFNNKTTGRRDSQ